VGNIRSLAGALDEHGRDALVMYFVSGHYRQPVSYSTEQLEQAAAAVARVRELGRRLDSDAPAPDDLADYANRFWDALADDFNTPTALAVVFEWIGEANRRLDAGERFGAGELREMLWALGLDNLLESQDEEAPPEAKQLLAKRQSARGERDFAAADAIRDELAEMGWIVRDTPEGARLVPRN
jgi:cysteinyl-tRNA synthetase